TIAKTLGDNTPLTISGQLGDSATDVTGENLRVDSDGNQLNLVMARNLTGLDSITIRNGGPVINVDGIDMAHKKITNLAPGEQGTDAVNVSQLVSVEAIATSGWDLATNDGTPQNVAPGQKVTFDDDGNVVVSNSVDADGNHTVNVGLSKDLTGLNSIGLD